MSTVASVDYVNKRIYLSADTVGVPLDTLDVYRDVRALRRTNEAHRKFRPIIIGGGSVQKTLTTYTQAYAQLLYGAHLVPYDTPHSLVITRETFSDDGRVGVACFDRDSIASNVDLDYQIDPVEIRIVDSGGGGGGGLTTGQAQQLETVLKLLRNKQITDPATGQMLVYDDDDASILLIANLYEDAAGTQAYRDQGSNRRDRLLPSAP